MTRARSSQGAWPLVGAVALAALVFDPSAASAATPKIALAVLVALVALAPLLPHHWRERPSPPAGVMLWLTLCGWMLVTLAWSPHADPTVIALWLAAGGIALSASRLAPSTRRTLTGRCASLVTAAAALAVIGQAVRGAEGIARHGGMGNPNWLGLTLACALPLVVVHAYRARGGERAAAAVTVVLGLVGLIVAESRVALLAIAIVLLAAAIGRLPPSRRARALLLAAIVGVALAFVAAPRWAEPVGGRLWLSSVSLDAWLRAPLLGHGGGAFPEAFLAAQAERLGGLPLERAARDYLFVTTAHGDWLQLAVEGGVVALALGLLAFLVGITTATRGSASAVAVVALCMLGDAPLRQPAVVLILALALSDTRALPRLRDRRDPLLAVTLTVALASLLPQASLQWLAERTAHDARDAEPSDRHDALERARRIAPWWSEPAFDAGLAALDLDQPERALAAFDDAQAAGMVGPALHVARGNALVRAGRPSEAMTSYRAALSLHPASFRAHVNLAEAARLAGDVVLAERHLGLARDLWPHHPKLAVIADALRRTAIHATTEAAHDEPQQSR